MGMSIIVFSIVNLFLLFSFQDQRDGWTPLLDKNLSQWETYLSYRHTSLTITGAPKDSNGLPIKPIGLNIDTCRVFSVIDDKGEPVLRVTGLDCPIPYEHNLENAVIPDEAKIEKGIKEVLGL